MNFKEYQEFADSTRFYSGDIPAIFYFTLGLSGEAGEASEKIKKYLRDGQLDKELFIKELGDVLWYLTACAKEFGYSLEDVARINQEKLLSRQSRNVLHGHGDLR